MPHWFLSTRAHSVGGPVGSLKVLDSARLGATTDLTGEFIQATRGREVFFVAHGYNVNQHDGIQNLDYWMDNLQIGNAIPVGILWPGDCIVPIFVDYVVEGREAIQSGDLIAAFLNNQLRGAASLCFVSHSLGARVVLQAISGLAPGITVRRCILMAAAIDDDCLTNEYKAAASRVQEISLLVSQRDDVLSIAYPLGNPIQGIIDRGHPYYQAALGREGPAPPSLPPPQLQLQWRIPDTLDYGHLDYIPGHPLQDRYPPGVDIPPDTTANPPMGTPLGLQPPAEWKPAWSAAFVSARYQRP